MLNRIIKFLLSGDVTFKTLRHAFVTHLIKVVILIHTVNDVLERINNTIKERHACVGTLEN